MAGATVIPSPSKSNPFAKVNSSREGGQSFERQELLPSPIKHQQLQQRRIPPSSVEGTPKGPSQNGGTVERASAVKSASKGKWRLLWRGGLEIGQAGYRLDGITFAARLFFPSVPLTPSSSFSSTPQRPPASTGITASPFAALPSAETDLCLSFESLRGRKSLRVRGIVDLPEDEQLDGGDDGEGVHVYIAPSSTILLGYFQNHLCRSPILSSSGRTLTAIAIGLGDEGVNNSISSTVLIYGQLKHGEEDQPKQIGLMAARRKPAPVSKAPRPGEPLPRASLFPVRQDKKPPVPFQRRSSLALSSAFARSRSQSAIYMPPPQSNLNTRPQGHDLLPPGETSSGSRKKLTPGRRGEKRKKPVEEEEAEAAEKRRRSGKITLGSSSSNSTKKRDEGTGMLIPPVRPSMDRDESKEDIFGKKIGARPGGVEGNGVGSEVQAPTKGKRPKISPTESKNKASIKKRLLNVMEGKGMPRSDPAFKDLFAIVNKGTSFAFRNVLSTKSLTNEEIENIINIHLDMYWLPIDIPPPDVIVIQDDDGEEEDGDGDGETLGAGDSSVVMGESRASSMILDDVDEEEEESMDLG